MIFELGGVRFNNGGPLAVMGFINGGPEQSTQDTARAGADGVVPGVDSLGAATWEFDLQTRGRNLEGALAADAALGAAWRDKRVRRNPLVTVPLRYERAGQWRRVYGRPGPYAGINAGRMSKLGRGTITADFRVLDPRHYADRLEWVTLTAVVGSSGGMTFPGPFPMATTRSAEPRAGLVVNEGDTDTPLTVTFHGPGVAPRVVAEDGWEVGITKTLAYDEAVTVDARAGTVTNQDGQNIPGVLTHATWLTRALLPPGQSELSFHANDATGTATADLAWRHAYTTL